MQSLLIRLLVLSGLVPAQLVVPLVQGASAPQPFDRNQAPLMDPAGPGPAMPPGQPSPAEPPSNPGSGVMLSDVMGRDRSINLFAGFVRDVESASRRLDDASQNTTVLAPLNSAVEKLPRKPWEDPAQYSVFGPNAYEGGEGQDRAQQNLRRFVEAHMVPVSPWSAGDKVKTLGADRGIWWEEKDGIRVIQPGGIEVVSVAGTVANGQVWIIKDVRNYA